MLSLFLFFQHIRKQSVVLNTPLAFVLWEMQPSRLPPQSPHPTRTSPIRHGKRFGSLTVPEEQREAAIKGEAAGSLNAAKITLGVSINTFKCIYCPFSTTASFVFHYLLNTVHFIYLQEENKGRMEQQCQLLAGLFPCLWT